MITPTLREHVKVRVSADGSRAHLVMGPPGECGVPTREELIDVLKEAGVVFGILPEGLDQAMKICPSEDSVLVAEGVSPVDGKDGTIELLIGPLETLAGDNQTIRVNLRERHFVHNVVKGDRLAIIHPPEPGRPGYTVSGETLSPNEGKPTAFSLEPKTGFAPGDERVIVALEDGHAFLREGGGVRVAPVITIPGDIDYAVGNIDFVGTLVINGDIKSDFTVKVKKNLEVYGNIEDSQIEVGGNVVVRKGFVGRGKGQITGGGNVIVQHLLSQTLISAGDIVIEKESVNGNVCAGGKILSPRAVIAGGQLDAQQDIEVQTLGSADGSMARVRTGHRGRILDRLAVVEKEVKQAEKQLGEIKEVVFRMIRMKLDVPNLGQEKETVLAKLQEAQKILPKQLEALHREKLRLTEDLHKTSEARIIVRGTVHENVLLEINGIRKLVESALCGVIFYEHAGVVEAQAL